jgi:hypothetical protein
VTGFHEEFAALEFSDHFGGAVFADSVAECFADGL